MSGILILFKHFEETGCLADCLRSGRPSLREGRAEAVQSIMKDLAKESSSGSSSTRETGNV